jgi:hypothetical protein
LAIALGGFWAINFAVLIIITGLAAKVLVCLHIIDAPIHPMSACLRTRRGDGDHFQK